MNYDFSCPVFGQTIEFHTQDGLFSPTAPDRGTLAMLRHVEITKDSRVLDLGCGWGYVSVYACLAGAVRVDACDINEDAAFCTRENLTRAGLSASVGVSDGLDAVKACDYTLILSNPPYQSDFAVAKKFIAQAYAHLSLGGRLVMVTKRRDWYKNRLIAVFGGVQIAEDDGYFVFTAEKRPKKPEKPKEKQKLSKKLERKYKKEGQA